MEIGDRVKTKDGKTCVVVNVDGDQVCIDESAADGAHGMAFRGWVPVKSLKAAKDKEES